MGVTILQDVTNGEFGWPVRVYHEDTDNIGIVYHANYLKYMERARTEWLRHHRIEQPLLKREHGIVFAVAKIELDYLKPAFFNDMLNVTVRSTRQGRASFVLSQRVVREPDDVLCRATVRVACVDATKLRPHALPSSVTSELQREN